MASKASNYCYCHMDGNNLNGEDSGDENSNCIPRSFAEMIFDNTECYMCNGFFGPCFGEPICATCHAFLFPNYVMSGENSHQFTEKSDDGDSGNDEPTDTLYNMDKQGPCEKFGYCVRRISAIPPPDNLATRLELLSVSSDQNKNNYSASIQNLPTEVLLGIFSYLDDFSLWSVANVCRRWRSLALYETPVYKWQQLTTRRFPLFKPLTTVEDWFQTYTSLMNSCSCGICLQQMTVRIRPSGEEGSWRRNRLRSELKILRSDPPDGIQAIPLDSPTCCHWQATIQGPAGSPYEGGIFFLYLQVPYSYPMCPPIVRFLTKIFHPNVSRHGDVGIDSIHYNWSLALTLNKVLISVQSLLTDPYCEVCMEPDIGELYMRDQQKFEAIARRWTWLYAMADIMPNS